jgi:hypothetical protein
MGSTEVASGEGIQRTISGGRGLALRNVVDRLGRFIPANPRREAVTTTLRLDRSVEQAWEGLRFYEDIPTRPSALLRILLPTPVRSEGQKVQPGGLVRCTYDGGRLTKRITTADPPHLLRFEVVEQQLGIEHCVSIAEGSYEFRQLGRGCEVLLTTAYRGHLRPRFLWRPLERALAHAVHRHILEGMRDLLEK